jgi:hypothetical protein
MRIAFEAIIAWVILSCMLGPLLTWAFFYPLRRSRAAEQAANAAENAFHAALAEENPARGPGWVAVKWDSSREFAHGARSARQIRLPW